MKSENIHFPWKFSSLFYLKIHGHIIYQRLYVDLSVVVDSASSLKFSVGVSSAGAAAKRSRYHHSVEQLGDRLLFHLKSTTWVSKKQYLKTVLFDLKVIKKTPFKFLYGTFSQLLGRKYGWTIMAKIWIVITLNYIEITVTKHDYLIYYWNITTQWRWTLNITELKN